MLDDRPQTLVGIGLKGGERFGVVKRSKDSEGYDREAAKCVGYMRGRTSWIGVPWQV